MHASVCLSLNPLNLSNSLVREGSTGGGGDRLRDRCGP
uniref:Uncharacterized protein n=1 Tax=Siphoviridae sp. ctevH2 TaxID=2825593 RepID=A0A8S5UAM2_9CAUD|nr:MAG TPA: hypothetical protein [Siphoviridae sp. ctevH2]